MELIFASAILPQETGQQHALNFTKGCYIGQEIVERIRSRGNVHRMFTGFEVEGELPQPGTKVRANDKDVGEITSAARMPFPGSERTLALGYLAARDRQLLERQCRLAARTPKCMHSLLTEYGIHHGDTESTETLNQK